MKTLTRLFNTNLRWLALSAVLFAVQTLPAAVTFTVSPTSVSNTYNGQITLTVTNLTSGATVVVQKYLDLNGNGVIDNTDWLVQQFNLTDGLAGMVIGGVTNFNVPGDTDTTAGVITAKLDFRNGDFIQNVAGRYLYKVSSPTGSFAAITNPLLVTAFAYPQKFTGTVVSNGTTTALPGSVVMLFPPPRPGHNGPGGNPLGSAVTTSIGAYTIPAPAGTYTLVSFKSNFLANFATAPVVALGSGATVMTNISMTIADAVISGQVVDAALPSVGLPGLFLAAQSSTGLLGGTFTDTNGNFTAGVESSNNQWQIQTVSSGLISSGYVGPNNGFSATAGTTGLTIALSKATALFYGTIQDNLGNPVPGIDVEAEDNNGSYDSQTYTDIHGKYVAVALGGLNNDPWQLYISSDSNPTDYIFSQAQSDTNGGINLSGGETVQQNFSALAAPYTISGTLKDANGNPLAAVGVNAFATINGVDYNVGSSDTDSNGVYSLNVAPGTWTVTVNTGGGGNSLPNGYFATSPTVVVSTANVTANLTASQGTNTISGTLTDDNGAPISGVTVYAYINGQNFILNTDTDNNGNYSFDVFNGTWTVGISTSGSGALPGNHVTPQNQTVVINNNNDTTVDFIAPVATSTISGTLTDNNGNPIVGVGIGAFTSTYSAYVDTDSNGHYSLDVNNGNWNVNVNTCTNCGGTDYLPGNYIAPSSQFVVISNDNLTVNFVASLVVNQSQGSLEVTISPQGAITAGATWSVDGGASQQSGTTLSGLSVGNHTVSFSTVSGFTTPNSQTVSIGANQTTDVTGTYSTVSQGGSLQVTISPQAAITAGATWSVDSGASQQSGTTLSGLSVGNHTVSFSTVSGFTTPASQTISIVANQTTNVTGTYSTVSQVGFLQVTITGSTAGGWEVDSSGIFLKSGATVSNLPVGSHTVSFKTVANLNTPANDLVTITAGATTTATGAYTAKEKPTLTVTAPKTGATVTSAGLTIAGFVKDDVAVTSVSYQLNSNGWTSATLAGTNWSANLNLVTGTNTINIYAEDTAGNFSTTNTLKVFYAVYAPLAVIIHGPGKISPNYNGSNLVIGKPYSMTATAGTGSKFTGWQTSLNDTVTTSTKLTFTMSAGLSITANFEDTTKPTISLTTTISTKGSNSVVTLSGKASDNVGVQSVYYTINSGPTNYAVVTTNHYTNWTAVSVLNQGANVVKFYSQDAQGNVSTPAAVTLTDESAGLAPLSVSSVILNLDPGSPSAAAVYVGMSTYAYIQGSNFSVGDYTYTQTGPSTAEFAFQDTAPAANSLESGVVTLMFDSTTNGTYTNTTGSGGNFTMSGATGAAPLSLDGTTLEGESALGGAFINNYIDGTFTSTNVTFGGSGFGTNTYALYSPQIALLVSTYTDSLHPALTNYALLNFADDTLVSEFAAPGATSFGAGTFSNIVPATAASGHAPKSLAGLQAAVTEVETNNNNGVITLVHKSFLISFGDATYAEVNSNTNDDSDVGTYTYTRIAPNTGQLVLAELAPPFGKNRVVPLSFSSATSAVNNGDNSHATLTFSQPAPTVPTSLVGDKLKFTSGTNITDVLFGYGMLTNITQGGTNTYTFGQFGPQAALLQLEQGPDTTKYFTLWFTGALTGNYVETKIESNTTTVNVGTFKPTP